MSDTDSALKSEEQKSTSTTNESSILRASRSSIAGWLTRMLKPLNEGTVSKSPAVLSALQNRISGQLKKLQTCHDRFVETLTDPTEIEETEQWMNKYFEDAANGLETIDKLLMKKPSIPSATENHEDLSTSTESAAASVQPSGPSQNNAESGTLSEQSSSNSSLEADNGDSTVTFSSQEERSNQDGINSNGSYTGYNQQRPKKSIDAWIDDLICGEETSIPSLSDPTSLTSALARLEVERDLPKIGLPTFDGSALKWPPFVEQFYIQVHSRPGLTDCRRMDLLQSHVQGDAKDLIKGLGYSGVNYAQSLKELKFAFGHRVNVARAYVNAIACGSVVPSGDAVALRKFYVSVRDCISTLNQMEYTHELHSSDVLQRTSKRIPGDRRTRWNDFVRNICRTREPNLMDLQSWLKDCVESDFSPFALPVRQSKPQVQLSSPRPTVQSSATINATSGQDQEQATKKCLACNGDHHFTKCRQYTDKSPEDRYNFAKSHKLCFNCLSSNHQISNCTSSITCKISGCTRKHHTSLHRRRNHSATNDSIVNNVMVKKAVYFQVVPVIVQGRNGCCRETFALLDSASDISMIDAELAMDLGLKGQSRTLNVHTINSSMSLLSSSVSLSVRECNNPEASPIWIHEVWTRRGHFNCAQFKASNLQHVKHLQDLPLQDIKPHDVKMLIGANVPLAHLQLSSREGPPDEPVAIQTRLGWCIMGSGQQQLDVSDATVNFLSSDDSLSSQIEQFWKSESFGIKADFKKPMSVQDQRALEVLHSNTRVVDGHFQVPMLWRKSLPTTPDDRSMAERRFKSLLKGLEKKPELQRKYSDVMNGYIMKGHARKLTKDEAMARSEKTWYLPHHCVLNSKKPNKVRVVFDAAATFNDVSLNKRLITGPDLLNGIFGVIQRFRMKPIAVVADISDMYHQVRVPEEDSDSLRFLWKQNLTENKPPEVYKMLVHIFGAADSPCCANYALQRVARDIQDEDTRQVVLRNFYVDDMLMAASDVSSAIKIATNLSQHLADKGFQLAKWLSSSPIVMQHFSQHHMPMQTLDLDFNDLPVERVLGIGWNVKSDAFVFNLVVKAVPHTKRSVVSVVSSIFDPCGYIAPYSFKAKLLIQDIWMRRLNWDDNLPEDLHKRWIEWQDELQYLRELSIPRYVNLPEKKVSVELHLFSDASEAGFASVAYLRIVKDSQRAHCVFMAAKTHVAPIKQILTIPKLELQGAVMSVRLAAVIQEEIDEDFDNVFYWTDSLTVLRYIYSEVRRWKIFIANRVSEIREVSEPAQWKYVPSALNPADLASRGCSSMRLQSEDRWFDGPEFLSNDEFHWPATPELASVSPDDENLKKASISNLLSQDEITMQYFNISKLVDIHRFSSWYRLKKHTAWILRAVRNFLSVCRHTNVKPVKCHQLQCSELQDAELCLVQLSQQECFAKELACLKKGEELDHRSNLLPLDPFMDFSQNVIRVGGRLRRVPEASLEFMNNQPILLPYNHHITKIILQDIHQTQAHCGPEHLISSVRKMFWPIKCRQLAKNIIHKCWECRRRSVKPSTPFMADLPQQRLQAFTRPFQYTGIDYFGPMIVKRARSRLKKWGCLFTCLTTRAIHLEIADSLEADDFIMALRCFIGRRGKPDEIFSDNGTNFHGADTELRNAMLSLDDSQVNEYVLRNQIKWHFIPPHAPHFGGAWERLVRSVKAALKTVLKEQCVTEPVLRTTLIEVEYVINSRPLTYNSCDPNDYNALSPNHFLMGSSGTSTLLGTFGTRDLDSRKRWRQTQVLADHIWKRWLAEYLPSLTVRQKWTKEQRNHAVNDLVLMINEHLPRGQWQLGRIVEVHASEDGRIRKVTVKTQQGTYVRPSTKVCLLEEAQV